MAITGSVLMLIVWLVVAVLLLLFFWQFILEGARIVQEGTAAMLAGLCRYVCKSILGPLCFLC